MARPTYQTQKNLLKENNLSDKYNIIELTYPEGVKDLNELLQAKQQQQQPQEPQRKVKREVAMPGG